MVRRQRGNLGATLVLDSRFWHSVTMKETNPITLVGVGLYTSTEAARLTAMRPDRVRRWINGYDYRRGGEAFHSAPLWNTDIVVDDIKHLSFRDLLELRLLKLFHERAGLSLPTIRKALRIARDVLGEEHPFSSRAFRTDGRRIFLEISTGSQDGRLLDLMKKQYAFKNLVEPSFKDIEFEDGTPSKWWPLSKSKLVVLDPKRSFGQPIEPYSGVPTKTLADAVFAEGSIRLAAESFEVTDKAVRDALKFESMIEGQKQAA